MTNTSGDDMIIHDEVEAHTLGEQPNEQIFHENDYIEVSQVIDSGEAIMVKGISHVSGDSVTYIIPAFTLVGLWSV